ncbi:DUF3939 domain-containing protein [Alkalicoccus luteus]|uniref:DUF3939 domain-containing protein n=1 Tax=Alkalicoccus luteus TaxID=1237094 RepID=UPI0040342B41
MFRRKQKKQGRDKAQQEPEVISCSLEEVRQAVNAFAESAGPGISLRTLVTSGNKLDAELLIPYLNGLPDRPFYMSKETFELFEEPDTPRLIDHAQIACDQYFLETGELPLKGSDQTSPISYFKLKNYLREEPPFDLYLHPEDRMVTHRKPAAR